MSTLQYPGYLHCHQPSLTAAAPAPTSPVVPTPSDCSSQGSFANLIYCSDILFFYYKQTYMSYCCFMIALIVSSSMLLESPKPPLTYWMWARSSSFSTVYFSRRLLSCGDYSTARLLSSCFSRPGSTTPPPPPGFLIAVVLLFIVYSYIIIYIYIKTSSL